VRIKERETKIGDSGYSEKNKIHLYYASLHDVTPLEGDKAGLAAA
jgi:hypothetical protein